MGAEPSVDDAGGVGAADVDEPDGKAAAKNVSPRSKRISWIRPSVA